MNLEQMTAKIRPRKSWEAIDLGVALVQQNVGALYKIWFLVTLPIFLISSIVFINHIHWPLIIFWFLKPLWERPLLHFISRQLFSERLEVKTCVKQFFSLAKIQWFASLTWRRLSLTRSLDLPVIQLEGLTGHIRQQRLRVIHSIGSSSAVWLTVFFLALEAVMYLGMFALAYLFLPQNVTETVDIWSWVANDRDSPYVALLLNVMLYLAMSLVAPFYTVCGFVLYINQRTHLEAWDIELAFKRLAKRLTQLSEYHPVKLVSCLLAVSLSVLLLQSAPLKAQETVPVSTEQAESELPAEEQPNLLSFEIDVDQLIEKSVQTEVPVAEQLSHQQAKEKINNIKRGELFNHKTLEYRYQRRNVSEDDTPVELDTGSYSRFWYWVGPLIAFIAEFALWMVFGLLILFLVVRYRHLISGVKLPEMHSKKRPQKLFGLDLKAESLPSKPWAVALKLVEAQEYREALSLLYRASLIWYIDHSNIHIREGDTELECLSKIIKLEKTTTQDYMRQLTNNWRQLAYAHQIPSASVLIDFCHQWPQLFNLSEEQKDKNLEAKNGH